MKAAGFNEGQALTRLLLFFHIGAKLRPQSDAIAFYSSASIVFAYHSYHH